MKQVFLTGMVCLLATGGFSQSRDTIRLYWNKELLLQGNITSNQQDTPVVVIKKNWLSQKSSFRIVFKQADKRAGWRRTFQFTDSLNNIFLQKDFNFTSGNYSFNTSAIKNFLQKNGRLLLYSFQQPPENSLLNGIRIERYLLAKLILK